MSVIAVVDKIFSGYRQEPDQNTIYSRGDEYLMERYPNMSYIVSTSITINVPPSYSATGAIVGGVIGGVAAALTLVILISLGTIAYFRHHAAELKPSV
jgi:hypothetical protein